MFHFQKKKYIYIFSKYRGRWCNSDSREITAPHTLCMRRMLLALCNFDSRKVAPSRNSHSKIKLPAIYSCFVTHRYYRAIQFEYRQIDLPRSVNDDSVYIEILPRRASATAAVQQETNSISRSALNKLHRPDEIILP